MNMKADAANPNILQKIMGDPGSMDVVKKTGIGGLIGMVLGKPKTGLLGGLLYGLFNKGGGMSDGMKSVINSAGEMFGVDASKMENITKSLGDTLFGNRPSGSQEASGEAHRQAAADQHAKGETSSGIKIPSWLKVGGLAVAGLLGVDLFSNMFQSLPFMFGGGANMMMDPMAMMYGGGNMMDPMASFSMPWYNGFSGGMFNNPLMDLLKGGLLLGGGALLVSKLTSSKSE